MVIWQKTNSWNSQTHASWLCELLLTEIKCLHSSERVPRVPVVFNAWLLRTSGSTCVGNSHETWAEKVNLQLCMGLSFQVGCLVSLRDPSVFSELWETRYLCLSMYGHNEEVFGSLTSDYSHSLLLHWRFLLSLIPFPGQISVLLGSSPCWSTEYKVTGLVSSVAFINIFYCTFFQNTFLSFSSGTNILTGFLL